MKWKDLKDEKPPAYIDILVTDGERCWVAQTFNNLDVFLASHPDYRRKPENEYGAPYVTCSKPTHWCKLPELKINEK